MQKHDLTILVTGATGRQGGAVARKLLTEGWHVRALTRATNQPAALELANMGADVIRGDLRDRRSLDEALGNDVYGVFAVQSFQEGGVADEMRQGKNLADAAAYARISHFIYSSVAAADRDSGVPFFESKWEIEQYIRSLGLPSTIFRPVFFMENFSAPHLKESILAGRLSLPIAKESHRQMVALDDIAAFVALAFDQPGQYIGKAYEIAGDELTMIQAASFMSRAIGRTVKYEEVPIEEVRSRNKDMARMFEYLNTHPFQADIPMLRQMHPGLMSFEGWLKQTGWAEEEVKIGAHATENI